MKFLKFSQYTDLFTKNKHETNMAQIIIATFNYSGWGRTAFSHKLDNQASTHQSHTRPTVTERKVIIKNLKHGHSTGSASLA